MLVISFPVVQDPTLQYLDASVTWVGGGGRASQDSYMECQADLPEFRPIRKAM